MSWADFQGILEIASLPEGPLKHKNVLISGISKHALSVDYLGVPRATVGAEGAYRHLDQLIALAQHPNVAVKATGQAGYATDAYPFPSIHDALHRVFDAFGPRRMFWGTDITRMHCTWRQCVTLFTEELRWLQGADLALVMGRAWCDWIGWDVGAAEAAERAQAHDLARGAR
jgi:hypothetical protein